MIGSSFVVLRVAKLLKKAFILYNFNNSYFYSFESKTSLRARALAGLFWMD